MEDFAMASALVETEIEPFAELAISSRKE